MPGAWIFELVWMPGDIDAWRCLGVDVLFFGGGAINALRTIAASCG